MPDNVGNISVGVYITHPIMDRIDKLRAVSNLLVWLLRSHAWQEYSADANAGAIVDVLSRKVGFPCCDYQTPYRPNTRVHLLSNFH